MRTSKKKQGAPDPKQELKDGKKAYLHPQQPFHFEMGKALAENLGYPAELLDRVPEESIDKFAGIGYFFHLIEIHEGERVAVLGDYLGMDAFIAGIYTGLKGDVVSIDMIGNGPDLAGAPEVYHIPGPLRFYQGPHQTIPLRDASVDVLITNGMIHQIPDKAFLFREIARILRPGGKIALADIVATSDASPVCKAGTRHWAAARGSVIPVDQYTDHIAEAGLKIVMVEDNPPYILLSRDTWNAAREYGIKSISLLAMKP